jgi:hypothetical protein
MRFARSRMQISAMLQRSESKEEQHGPVEQRNALESMAGTSHAGLRAQRRKHWKKRPSKGDDVCQSLRGVAAARCAGAKARPTKHKTDGR